MRNKEIWGGAAAFVPSECTAPLLIDFNLAKVGVEGSNPFARSSFLERKEQLSWPERIRAEARVTHGLQGRLGGRGGTRERRSIAAPFGRSVSREPAIEVDDHRATIDSSCPKTTS